MKIKCSRCGYVGEESEFPKGHDFFQKPYVKACPKCDNRATPGGAAMRMFGGPRPFVYVRENESEGEGLDAALRKTLHRSDEAS